MKKQHTYGALIGRESMEEAEAAKLLQRLRAAALPVRIQKPIAQHGGSGIFPQLPRSHACRRGGSVKTVYQIRKRKN